MSKLLKDKIANLERMTLRSNDGVKDNRRARILLRRAGWVRFVVIAKLSDMHPTAQYIADLLPKYPESYYKPVGVPPTPFVYSGPWDTNRIKLEFWAPKVLIKQISSLPNTDSISFG